MARRMGKALLAAIKTEAGPPAATKESVLGNPQRRRVLQYFCLHPCGSLGEVAKALGLSPATVRFHGLRLVAAGYLAASRASFFPAGLVDGTDVPVFEALATAGPRRRVREHGAHGDRARGCGEDLPPSRGGCPGRVRGPWPRIPRGRRAVH